MSAIVQRDEFDKKVAEDSGVVTIIIPCRNEEKFIGNCLDSVLKNDFPKERLEVLVVDGLSDDGTRKLTLNLALHHTWIRLLDNAKRTTPSALNLGIQHAIGEIIIRMDAHTVYPKNYVSSLVRWLNKTGAENVGGLLVTCPANDSAIARAIAIAMSHPFGVGNAYFRVGVNKPTWVDTVPFGCYRREVFERIGLFDDELVRNQDDEFNHRLIKNGGRILLVPEIVSYYYAKESFLKLGQMYYQYGYFKPLAARKTGKVMTVRQLIPTLFVLSLVFTASLAPLFGPMRLLLAAVVVSYASLAIVFSIRVAFDKGVRCGLWLSLVFPVLHFSYGLGYLKGILDFLILRKTRTHNSTAVPLSR